MKLAQVSISFSVVFVWTFRYHNVITEFKSFGLSDLTRNFVGVSKIALSTLLVTGVWFPSLVFLLPQFSWGSLWFLHNFSISKIKNTLLSIYPPWCF